MTAAEILQGAGVVAGVIVALFALSGKVRDAVTDFAKSTRAQAAIDADERVQALEAKIDYLEAQIDRALAQSAASADLIQEFYRWAAEVQADPRQAHRLPVPRPKNAA